MNKQEVCKRKRFRPHLENGYIAQREKYQVEALRLHYEEGLCYNRVSRILPVSRETIKRWCKFAEANGTIPMKVQNKSIEQTPCCESTQSELRDTNTLETRIRELEAALRKAELRADLYDEMINVAEAKFKISIRKKAGAKQ